MEPFKLEKDGKDDYGNYSSRKRSRSTLFEEIRRRLSPTMLAQFVGPTCRLVESIDNTNLTGVLNAIADGARLLDGRENALEYAVCKVLSVKSIFVSNRKQALEVCIYLMECHPEVLTENCANKIFVKNDNDLTKAMIQVLVASNERLSEQLFRKVISNLWDFPIARVYSYLPNRTYDYEDEVEYWSDVRKAFGENFVDKVEYFTKYGFGKVLPVETEIKKELFEII